MRILAVCLGNVCRSPMIERLLRSRLPEDFTVTSAGTMGMVGRPMEPDAVTELERLGGTADGFTASDFAPSAADAADLVLTATSGVRSRVLEDCPSALRRSFTVLEMAFLVRQAPESLTGAELVAWAGANRSLARAEDLDVVDPMRRGPEVHRQAADLIDQATRSIADALTR